MQPILKINLTNRRFETLVVPASWEQDFLGGASLAARLLYDRLIPELDPFSPEAPLLFLTGPLTGTAGPAVGRFVVCGLSPATRLWAESNCGGFWGLELRKTGLDGLLISGHAPDPVYLWIQDGVVEIRSASHLWGLDTYQTQYALKTELGQTGIRVASIGIAGEARIPFALILCDHGRVAGRTGLGAVMGSKNLKAIAVRGTREFPVFNPVQFAELRSKANRQLKADSVSQVLRELGTSGAMDYFDYVGDMPKRYFQFGKNGSELKTSGANMAESILVGVSTCHGCVIACGRVVQLDGGDRRKGPELETLVGFGVNLGLNDLETAVLLGEKCDRFGMDSISLSNTIGLAFAMFEQGRITQHDTGGLVLRWGNAEAVSLLVDLTARRQGFGAHLANGARLFGRQFGFEEEAVQVNGLEVPYHDPRGSSGMALVYATSPRGACHNQSDYFLVDVGQADQSIGLEYFPPKGGAEKTTNVIRHQDWKTLYNSLVMCIFTNIPPELVVDLLHAVSGYERSVNELMLAGERAWNLKRLINNRLGLTRQNDRLPKSLLKPYRDDPDGYIPDFQAMLSAYYERRGWDPLTGYPTQEKLQSLGLDQLDMSGSRPCIN